MSPPTGWGEGSREPREPKHVPPIGCLAGKPTGAAEGISAVSGLITVHNRGS